MKAAVRTLGLLILFAALGVGAGLGLAGQEVARQSYVSAGLWRTCLWVAGRGARLGALVGVASGIVLLLLLALWSAVIRARDKRAEPAADPGERFGLLIPPLWATRAAVFIAALSAAGVLVIPNRLSVRFGPPYLPVAAASLLLVWVLGTWFAASAARRVDDPEQCERWFRFRWLTAIGLIWLIAVYQVWARVNGWEPLAALAFGALIVCAAAYLWLAGPARVVHDRLGRSVGAAVMGRPGRVVSAAVLVAGATLWTAG